MPIKYNSKILMVGCIGLALGFTGRYLMAQGSSDRHPASVDKPVLKPLKIGKHLALLTTEISAAGAIPEKDDQEIQLIGSIQIQQSMEGDLHYQWTLPEGVHVVEGQLEDELSQVRAGQTVQVRLSVTGFSKESQKLISLQANAQKGTLRLGNSAIISSRSEDTWEAIAPQMKEEAIKQLNQTTSE